MFLKMKVAENSVLEIAASLSLPTCVGLLAIVVAPPPVLLLQLMSFRKPKVAGQCISREAGYWS